MNIEKSINREKNNLLKEDKKLNNHFHKILKKANRQIILSAMMLAISFQSQAGTKELVPKVKNILGQLQNQEISVEKASNEFNKLMDKVEREVKKDIKNGKFAEAEHHLNYYLQVAQLFKDKETQIIIFQVKKELHNCILEKINKKGLFKYKDDIILINTVHANTLTAAKLTADRESDINRRKVFGSRMKRVALEEIGKGVWKYITIIEIKTENGKTYRNTLSPL